MPPTSVKKDRRRTINCGLARPPLTPAQQEARILPQRVITPRFSPGVQSIWFQSQSEHPDVGVSLADIVDDGAEGLMIAPEERVFQRFGLRHDEIQFSILVSEYPTRLNHPLIRCLQWPGYGHISWIASIPVNFREGSGHPSGPITRRLLASVVAEHFQAFMIVSLPATNESVRFRSLTVLRLESLVLAIPPPRFPLEDYERSREWHQV